MSIYTSFRDHVEALLASGFHSAETIFKSVFAGLSPMLKSDLESAAEAGVSAAIATVSAGPQVMTVSAVEAALLAGGRAAIANAKTNGRDLTIHTGLALVAAAGLVVPQLTASQPAVAPTVAPVA